MADMATRITQIGRRRRGHLYLEEWFEARGLNDEKIGKRLGLDRTTVWKWRKQQHRLDPGKIAALAGALDCEPEDLWRPPSRPSIDAITKKLPDEIHGDVVEFARRLAKRA